MSKLKIKDLNTVANVYQIPTTGTGATITGSLEGDVIVIDGNSSAYTIKASGSKVTISGINDFGKKFTVTVTFDKSKAAVAQTAKFAFADGTVELGYNPTTKTVTSGGTPVGKASVGVSTLPVDNTVTADSFEGSDGSAPALGKTFTLTTDLDNVAGTNGADTIDARSVGGSTSTTQVPVTETTTTTDPETGEQTTTTTTTLQDVTTTTAGKPTLDETDVVNGGDGRDTIIVDGSFLPGQLVGVRSVEIVRSTAAEIELNATAAAAGIDTLTVSQTGQGTYSDIEAFNGVLTVNGSNGNDFVDVNLAVAGNKTLNLGAGFDVVGVTPVDADQIEGSVEVRFVSANVGNGTDNNVTFGNVTVNDEGTILRGFGDQFKVQGINADGSVAADQNRGNFSEVQLGTSAADNLNAFGFNGNYYINAGAGNDRISSANSGGQRNFLVGGSGDDEINIFGNGTTVALAGTGNDTVNVGDVDGEGEGEIFIPLANNAGQQNIDLGDGVNEVAFGLGELAANQKLAADVTSDTLNDTVKGGAGVDTLRAYSLDLTGVSNAGGEMGTVKTISGIEVVSVIDALSSGIVLENVQSGLKTITLEAGVDSEGEGFVDIGAGTATINLAASLNNTLFVNGGVAAGDTLNLVNTAKSVGIVQQDGSIVQTSVNVFSNDDIRLDGVETLNINGTGNGAASLQVIDDISLNGSNIGTVQSPKTAKTTVNFTGSNAFGVDFIFADEVNASGLTGAIGLAAETSALNVIGSAGKDIINVSVFTDGGTADNPATVANEFVAATNASVNTAGGDDIVAIFTEGDGTVNVDTGAGNDRVIIDGRFESKLNIKLGAGSDTVSANTAINGNDTIDAGDGTDTLQLALVGAANIGAFSNFEVFDAAGLSKTLDTDILASKNTVSEFITSGNIGGAALTNIGAGIGFRVTGGSSHLIELSQKVAGAQTVTLDIDQAVMNDGMDVAATAGIVLKTATTANVVFDSSYIQETDDTTLGQSSVTLSTNAATVANVTSGGANSINNLSLTDSANGDALTTVNVSGAQMLNLAIVGASKLATVDASAATGGISFSVANFGANGTVKLGSGVDTISFSSASSNADGFDSIVGFEKASAATVAAAETTAQQMAQAAAIADADKLFVGSAAVAGDLTNGSLSVSVSKGVVTFSGTGPTTLADAIGRVDTALTAKGAAVVFQYLGDSFVFVNADDTDPVTLDGVDALIKLTGVTGVTNFVEVGASDNFFIV